MNATVPRIMLKHSIRHRHCSPRPSAVSPINQHTVIVSIVKRLSVRNVPWFIRRFSALKRIDNNFSLRPRTNLDHNSDVVRPLIHFQRRIFLRYSRHFSLNFLSILHHHRFFVMNISESKPVTSVKVVPMVFVKIVKFIISISMLYFHCKRPLIKHD